MEVLRHSGCNWSLGSVAANASGTVIAVAVRSSIILLRSSNGAFLGEIRQFGRAAQRARSLCFAKALGLTHLLAAIFDDGSWRVFDADTRRIVRSGGGDAASVASRPKEWRGQAKRSRQANAICFGEETPNLLFVAYADGAIDVFDLASSGADTTSGSVTRDRTLSVAEIVRIPFCLASIAGRAGILLVGGLCGSSEPASSQQGTSRGQVGSIAAIDIRNGAMLSSLSHAAGPVHSIDTSLVEACCFVAFVSGDDGIPAGAVLRDGQLAIVNSSGSEGEGPVSPSPGFAGRKLPTPCVSSVSWMFPKNCDTRIAVCSKGSGSLQLWQVTRAKPSLSLVKALEGHPAHTRQVFSIVPTCATNSGVESFRFCTASMDRRICGWSISGESLTMEWETLGVGGFVHAIAYQNVVGNDVRLRNWLGIAQAAEDEESCDPSETLIATGYGDGVIGVDCMFRKEDGLLPQTILRCQIPRMSGKAPVVPQSILFCRFAIPVRAGNHESEERMCVVVSTADGRIGCIVLGTGEPREIEPEVSVSWSKPFAEGKVRSAVPRRLHVLFVDMQGRMLVLRQDGGLGVVEIARRGKSLALSQFQSLRVSAFDQGIVSASATTGFPHERAGTLNSRRAAVASDTGELSLLDLTTPQSRNLEPSVNIRCTITCSGEIAGCWVSSLSFNESGNRLAAGFSDGSMRVYSVPCKDAGQLKCELSLLSLHTRRVSCLSWVPKGTCVVSAGEDGIAVAVDALQGNIVSKMKGHSGRVLVCVAVGGDFVVTGGEDCTIREWQLSRQPK